MVLFVRWTGIPELNEQGVEMNTIEESVEVEVPVATAYNQWTQFETFPSFMGGVEKVTQLDEKRLHWVAKIAGKQEEWDAEIVEQIPDKRIAWRSTGGAPNSGVVSFESAGENRTRVMLQMEVEPRGLVETVGSAIGLDSHQVKNDLDRFKTMIEQEGAASGAWRGRVDSGETARPG